MIRTGGHGSHGVVAERGKRWTLPRMSRLKVSMEVFLLKELLFHLKMEKVLVKIKRTLAKAQQFLKMEMEAMPTERRPLAQEDQTF